MTDPRPRSIETATLDYSDRYDPDRDFDAVYTVATGRRIARALRPRQRILELGCATGLMTTQLAGEERAVVAVDRSPPYLDQLDGRALPAVETLLADVETVAPGEGFDHVVMTNLLHEVGDPAALIGRAAGWLAPRGRIHLTVPNPRSVHRLVAVDAGMIASLHELSERGAHLGTRQLIDADLLADAGASAGLRVAERGGVMLKPLPNAGMAQLSGAELALLERLGETLPDHCAMSYLALEHDA